MAQSSDIYNQIQGIMGQLNPMLENQAGVSDYFTKGLNEAFQYNLPALQNAAKLESQLYSMPGNLMQQYNMDFGGQTGVDSNTRINNILSQLGSQTGLVNTARGLANQAGTNINDLATKLTDQYKTQVSSLQSQLNPLMSIWDRMYAEEQANRRAAANRPRSTTVDWDKIEETLKGIYGDTTGEGTTTNTNTTTTSSAPSAADIVKNIGGGLLDSYLSNSKVGNLYDKGKTIYNTGKSIADLWKTIF